jgi:hypothetical protein
MQEEKTPADEILKKARTEDWHVVEDTVVNARHEAVQPEDYYEQPCCDREAVTGYIDLIGDLLHSYKFRRTSQEWVLHSLNIYLEMSNDRKRFCADCNSSDELVSFRAMLPRVIRMVEKGAEVSILPGRRVSLCIEGKTMIFNRSSHVRIPD